MPRMLNSNHRHQLAEVCATLLPLGVDAAAALASEVEKAVNELHGDDGIRRLGTVLALLDSRFANLAIAGRFTKFSRLVDADRETLLLAWANGGNLVGRTAFQAIKRLAMFLHYTEHPPACYDPDLGAEPDRAFNATPTAIQPIDVNSVTNLTADVLIIGSGAGGGVVAGELAAAGFDVLVVEKGAAPRDAEFPREERRGFAELYERRGSLATVDRGVTVLAGSTLGGGTTVNWMTSLEPPGEVLEEWSRDFGFTAATSPEFRESIAAVSRRLNVNTDESPATEQNAVLERGCKALGYRVQPIPRNARGCTTCDTCSFGCRHGGKQDMRRTYLADAAAHGARFVVNAEVSRITHAAGQTTGAEFVAVDANGSKRSIEAHAKIVVAAAGAMHTPALLIRSGLTNRHIGQNLHLHPTTAVCGDFAEPVRSWRGAPQTRYCDEFANLDGRGHGVRFEVSPAHPGLWGLALAWTSRAEHWRRLERIAHMANIIILTRDQHSGQVKVDHRGQPVLHYRIAADDAGRTLRGVVEALRILAAAGAREVLSPHQKNSRFRFSEHEHRGKNFERYLAQVADAGSRVNDLGLFSAHQLSSCRIAASAKLGAVRPDGETHELKNLYVADGSLLPTACGVNPMLTIASLGHYVAQQIKEQLSCRNG